MKYLLYSHRFADIIINSDYAIRQEIEKTIDKIGIETIIERYKVDNAELINKGKKSKVGMQASLNSIFREKFCEIGWEKEKNVFGDISNDLVIDFWKRDIGIDVAFNHRSFIGGDLLRLQAAGEVKNLINVGVYICGTKEFTKFLAPTESSSMVQFERVRWYLENFYAVLTVPIWLIGLEK
jgi:hypothetical protein